MYSKSAYMKIILHESLSLLGPQLMIGFLSTNIEALLSILVDSLETQVSVVLLSRASQQVDSVNAPNEFRMPVDKVYQ
jgi:hypothetical protein